MACTSSASKEGVGLVSQSQAQEGLMPGLLDIEEWLALWSNDKELPYRRIVTIVTPTVERLLGEVDRTTRGMVR
jgi:hypothetical protein